jgi:hypothetical protein
MQQTKSQETSKNISNIHSGPKEAEAQRKLVVFVKVRKI